MLPAQRRDMGQQCFVDRSPVPGHRAEGSAEIDRIPQHDRAGEERYFRRPVLLAFSGFGHEDARGDGSRPRGRARSGSRPC